MSFKSIDEIVSQINFYINQLNSGKLAAIEIDALLAEVNQLQERLIILRYKAFENEVKGSTSPEITEVHEAPSFNFSSKNTPIVNETLAALFETEPVAEVLPTIDLSSKIEPEATKEEPAVSINQISLIDAIKEVELEKGDTDVRLSNFITNLKKNSPSSKIASEKQAETETNIPDLTSEPEQTHVKETIDLQALKISQSEAIVLPVAESPSNTFGKTSSTSNPNYAQVVEMPLGEKLQKQPIHDLGKAIGLNQRFLFINELFKQNGDDFQASIERLNSFEEFEEASIFLKEQIIPLYKWDIESKTVGEFMELIERRYMWRN